MGRKFSGKNGISIKLITEKITKDLRREKMVNFGSKRSCKATHKSGSLQANDWKNIAIGLEFFGRVKDEFFTSLENQLLLGEEEVSRAKKDIFGYRYIIDDLLRRLDIGSRDEYERIKIGFS